MNMPVHEIEAWLLNLRVGDRVLILHDQGEARWQPTTWWNHGEMWDAAVERVEDRLVWVGGEAFTRRDAYNRRAGRRLGEKGWRIVPPSTRPHWEAAFRFGAALNAIAEHDPAMMGRLRSAYFQVPDSYSLHDDHLRELEDIVARQRQIAEDVNAIKARLGEQRELWRAEFNASLAQIRRSNEQAQASG